jgi:hypothetical protein
MKQQRRIAPRILFLAAILSGGPAAGQTLEQRDQIGVTALRAVTTNLNGAGIQVAQAEADVPVSPIAFEVNPANVGQPVSLFTYFSANGSARVYPNTAGTNSWHAELVGNYFYGLPNGVATNVAQVDNYDADFFIENVVQRQVPINSLVVNQSFVDTDLNSQASYNTNYDNYAARFKTLFVSGAGNGGAVCPPSTCYNGISVAAYAIGASSSIGPTRDNGRCKPDLTAPSTDYTSWSTPQVSGAAALLLQAALRGDGGSDTHSAADPRTIKALLLNGAVKPADWTNASSSPLDARYGAGVVNVLNAYEQLAGGEQIFSASNSVACGTAHPPLAVTQAMAVNRGWDFEAIASDAADDAVNHYFFNVSNGMATVTLVWNRQFGQTNINDLDLFLIATASSNLVACSTSRVDNVEHLFVPRLAAGSYDLQVLKNGGTNGVSDTETYALAWEFVSPGLNFTPSGTNAVLSWPVYPAGFQVEAAANLSAPAWTTNGLPPAVITNRMNNLILSTTNGSQFFRLHRPNL